MVVLHVYVSLRMHKTIQWGTLSPKPSTQWIHTHTQLNTYDIYIYIYTHIYIYIYIYVVCPRGSTYTTMMELGPGNHNKDGLMGPNSRRVVYIWNPLCVYIYIYICYMHTDTHTHTGTYFVYTYRFHTCKHRYIHAYIHASNMHTCGKVLCDVCSTHRP